MRRFGTQWKEMQTVARYILQRLGQTLLILLIVSFITYLLIDFLPGDPIAAMLGGEISQETYDWWYQELNLDKPVLIRYVLWLKNALMGDFGHSASYSVPVLQIIGERVPVTLYLSVLAFLISVPLGILFGIISAVKRGKPADTAVTLTANVCCCLPQFWLGILLMYIFTIVLKWLPSSGWVWPWEDFGESVRRTIMPLTCLTIGGIASITRQTRSSMLEVIRHYERRAGSCVSGKGGLERQQHAKYGAPRAAFDEHGPARFLHVGFHERKAEPRPFGATRHERKENPVADRLGNARTVVEHFERQSAFAPNVPDERIAHEARAKFDAGSSRRASPKRFGGVPHKVEKDLREAPFVRQHGRNRHVVVPNEHNLGEFVRDEAPDVFEQFVKLHGARPFGRAVGFQQTLHEARQSVRLVEDHSRALAVFVAREVAFQELRRTANAAERIFHLVREVAQELPVRARDFGFEPSTLVAKDVRQIDRLDEKGASRNARLVPSGENRTDGPLPVGAEIEARKG